MVVPGTKSGEIPSNKDVHRVGRVGVGILTASNPATGVARMDLSWKKCTKWEMTATN